MLTIRNEQLRQLAEPLEAGFQSRLRDMLRQHVPAAAGDGLDGRLSQALRQVDTWGLDTERDAAFGVWIQFRFVDEMATEAASGLRALLSAHDLSSGEKVHLADRWLARQGWTA
jgi:hypothetical protein